MCPPPSSSSFLSMTTSCRRLYVMFITVFMASFLSVLTRLGHYPSISSHASCSKAVSKRRATSLLGPCTRCAKSKGCSWPKPTTCWNKLDGSDTKHGSHPYIRLGNKPNNIHPCRCLSEVGPSFSDFELRKPGETCEKPKVSCLPGLDLNVAICMTDEAAMLISPLCHLVLSYEFRCCICLSKEALVFAWLCWTVSLLMWNMDKRSLINSNLF